MDNAKLQSLKAALEAAETNQPHDYLNNYLHSGEKGLIKHLTILLRKMQRKGIRCYEYDDEYFRIRKLIVPDNCPIGQKLYPAYMYVSFYTDTKEYFFGGKEEDVVVSRRADEVIEAAYEWLHNNKPAVR